MQIEIYDFSVTYMMNLKVKRYVRSSMVVFEGDALFRPIIKMQAGWTDKGKSKLTIGVYYDRKSAMFQVHSGELFRICMSHL